MRHRNRHTLGSSLRRSEEDFHAVDDRGNAFAAECLGIGRSWSIEPIFIRPGEDRDRQRMA
jgi:hypothetical protein